MYWQSLGYVLVGVVVVLSLAPAPNFPLGNIPLIDKFFHFLAYGFLMLWFAQVYPPASYSIIAVLFIGMGASLEALQSMISYRTGEIPDMVANTLGVLLGWRLTVFRLDNLLEKFEKFILDKTNSR